MANTNGSAVPLVVPEPSSRSEADSYGYDGEVIHQPSYTVVVPVASDLFDGNTGINARRFLQTAIALADDNDGHVVLLGITEVADETTTEQVREYTRSDDENKKEQSVPEIVTERQAQLAQIVDVVGDIDRDVSVRALVRVVTDTTQGILAALGSGSETAVLLLRGTGFEESCPATAAESAKNSLRRVGHDSYQRLHWDISINITDNIHYLLQLSLSLGDDCRD